MELDYVSRSRNRIQFPNHRPFRLGGNLALGGCGVMMRTRWVCLGLAVLTLVCFGHVCLSEFINFDDPLYITDNPQVLGGLTWANVQWAFGASCLRAGYWIPLTWLSLQLDASIFGPAGAWGFHLTNLLFHLANVIAFFLVLERMTGDTGRSAMAAACSGCIRCASNRSPG